MRAAVLLLGILGLGLAAVPAPATNADDLADAPSEAGPILTNRAAKRPPFEYRIYALGSFSYQRTDTNLSSPLLRSPQFAARSAQFSLNAEFTAKPATWLTLRADAAMALSTQFPTNAPPSREGELDSVPALNELAVEWMPAKVFSLLVGKYRSVYGSGLFANPMDRWNPTAAAPGSPVQREGTWLAMASLHLGGDRKSILLGHGTVDAAFLPNFFRDPSGLPSLTFTNRLLSVGRFGFTASSNETNWTPSDMGGYLHLYGNLFQGDFHGVIAYTERQWQGGASYTKYLFNWLELHAETLFYGFDRANFAGTNGLYLDGLVGFRIEPTSDVSLVVEGLTLGSRPEAAPSTVADRLATLSALRFSSTTANLAAFPFRYAVLASFSWRNLVIDHLDVTVNGTWFPSTQEGVASARVDWRIGDHARLSFFGGIPSGPMDGWLKFTSPVLWNGGLEMNIGI